MGIVNRIIGQARKGTSTGTARTGRPAGGGRATPTPASGTRGAGGIAKRLLGGRRRGGL